MSRLFHRCHGAFGLINLAAIFLMTSGCGAQINGGGGEGDKLTLATSKALATGVIPAAGGTMAVAASGDVLDGLTIEVPAGAWPEDRTFTISSRTVLGHNLGTLFNPVTPLITIDNGGGYASAIVRVRIPLPATGQGVAVFFYDQATGELEGVPVVAQDATSITIATRHFSDLIASAFAYEILLDDYSTAFHVGVDNWQFANPGTALVPGGTCSGMSATALYYFDHLKGTGGPLYGRYDNNGNEPKSPSLGEDDSGVIRLCAEAQWYEGNFTNQEYSRWYALGEEKTALWTFYMFAYVMRVTGKPQYISIANEAGLGHALVVYRQSGPYLYVADPNLPSDDTVRIGVDLETEAMLPFDSQWNKDSAQIEFKKMFFLGRSAIVDEGSMSELFTQLAQGTVGQDFPEYHLKLTVPTTGGSGQELELPSTYDTTAERVSFSATADFTWRLVIYDSSGAVKATGPQQAAVEVALEPGANRLGVHIQALMTSSVTSQAEWVWTGFQWATITRQTTDGGNASGPCSVAEPSDTWLIEYDDACDGTFETDNLWHLRADGTVADNWLGTIKKYSWRVEGDKLIIDVGAVDFWYEGTLSADCASVTNGVAHGAANPSCWKAVKY